VRLYVEYIVEPDRPQYAEMCVYNLEPDRPQCADVFYISYCQTGYSALKFGIYCTTRQYTVRRYLDCVFDPDRP